jgi:hypothetical protein
MRNVRDWGFGRKTSSEQNAGFSVGSQRASSVRFGRRLIDNVHAFSVRNLAGDRYEVLGRVIDNVMTTEISSDLGLRVGTNGTDHIGSEMPRPRTKDMAHAAGSRMDQNIISRLYLVRSMQEIAFDAGDIARSCPSGLVLPVERHPVASPSEP